MVGPRERERLVYNGEIYNYRELRKELEGLGRRFRTSSDTEVLLAAYEAWGPGCLSKLNGIFAFVVWDPGEGTLFAARDPLGVKPLYYGWWDDRFYAASEAKAIVADGRVTREVDPEALDLFFHEGYVPAPAAIWRGMRKLRPGHHLTVHVGRGDQWNGLPEQERYYDIPFGRVDSLPLDEGGILEALDERLRTAVRRQMVSDVPIGAFLSGGVDSSLVVGYMAEHATGPIDTFSASFADDPRDEAPYAEAVSKRYGTRHHRVVMGRERLGDLNDLAWSFDEPFADPAAVPTAILSSLAREHVTVVLSGDGGDETHAGYPRYRRMAQMAWLDRVPLGARRALLGQLAGLAPSFRRRGALEQVVRDAADRYDAMTREMPPSVRQSFYSDDLITALRDTGSALAEGARPWRRVALGPSGPPMLDRVQRLDLLTYLPEQLLPKVDRASMRSSLEARVPFLDLEAVSFAARIPSRLRTRGGATKHLLRRLLASRLGEDFVKRRKQGFTVPTHQWIRSQQPEALRAALLPDGIERWLDPARVGERVLRAPRGLELAWPVLAFAGWVRAFSPSA